MLFAAFQWFYSPEQLIQYITRNQNCQELFSLFSRPILHRAAALSDSFVSIPSFSTFVNIVLHSSPNSFAILDLVLRRNVVLIFYILFSPMSTVGPHILAFRGTFMIYFLIIA